nr:glycoside hydrolase family 88 protein [Paenibacillus puerhi]
MEQTIIEETLSRIESKIERLIEHAGSSYPDHAGPDGIYKFRQADWWTSGFFPGMLWILYDLTGRERFKAAAWGRDADIAGWFGRPTVELNHDVGFQFLPTAVIKHTLTGDGEALRHGLTAANFLASRFHPAGGFIRAWNLGPDGQPRPGWAIVDCLMNLPLLFWASGVSGDPRYKQMAVIHADTILKHGLREDGSVSHICSFDPESGHFIETLGGQGAAPDSAWSRGTAWALYGYALVYRATGESRYLHAAKRAAHYFLAALPEDGVPYWDFRLVRREGEPRDTSAAVIAASGLLELAESVPDPERRLYEDASKRLLRVLTGAWTTWNDDSHQALLTGATGNRPLGHHVDFSLIFGDYFYLEAFAKLAGWKHRIF